MIDQYIITPIAERLKAAFDATIGHWLSLDWVPEIFFWYWWLFVLFVAIWAINRVFGWSRIVQIAGSILFLLGAIFVAGGHFMMRRLKKGGRRG